MSAVQVEMPASQRRARLQAPFGAFIQLARKKPLGFTGLVILMIAGFAALFAPLITPYGYEDTDFDARFVGMSSDHWFGTDNLGRDLYTRVLYGARVSFGISFAAVIIAKGLATFIGVYSGYYGGWFDRILQRFIDIWIALPTLVILLTLVAILGPSVQTLIIVIGLTYAPNSSRLIRSLVMSVREEPYVLAAHSLGATNFRIMLHHVLPNIAHLVIFSATVTLGAIILIAASLGFLGYGVPPPHPDLGAMLSGDGLTHMRRSPLIALWPGLVITLVVFAFNVFGDAVRDVLDPRLRGSR